MDDESWWDDDGEHVAAMQRVLTPLREPPRPWGDVLARARFATPAPVRSSVHAGRVALLAASFAGVLALGWWWGRSTAPTQRVEVESVAAPIETVVVPTPMPVPMPIVVADEAVADHARRELLLDHFDGMQRRREESKRRARARGVADDDEARERYHEVLKESVREVKAQEKPESRGPDVDCILDPVLPQCKRSTSGSPSSELPTMLTAAQVKKALAPRLAQAKACGPAHGAASREKVVVKLSIEGASGRVTSAHPLHPHDTGTLGACVAEALQPARFPRFGKPSLGVMYPVTMP